MQLDANGKMGGNLINGDRHDISPNGQLLLDLIERKCLILVNGTDKCHGGIIRIRNKNGKIDKSVLDYFIMCQNFYSLVISMNIDEDRKLVLTKCSKYKGATKLVKSDHNILSLEVKCVWSRSIQKRRKEIFNLRNKNCQEKFFEDTSKTTMLTNSLINKNVVDGGKSWLKSLNTIIHRNFKKIRISGKNKDESIQKNLTKWREENSNFNEAEITNIICEKNRKIILDQISCTADLSGNLSRLKMWKVKQKVCPKISSNLPVAKLDGDGNIISNLSELKDLYVRVYKHRLRHREIQPGLELIKELKENLFKMRKMVACRRKLIPGLESR